MSIIAADSQDDDDTQEPGPAALATLRSLEWPRLLEHVAQFAATHAGRQAITNMEVCHSPLRRLCSVADLHDAAKPKRACFLLALYRAGTQ